MTTDRPFTHSGPLNTSYVDTAFDLASYTWIVLQVNVSNSCFFLLFLFSFFFFSYLTFDDGVMMTMMQPVLKSLPDRISNTQPTTV